MINVSALLETRDTPGHIAPISDGHPTSATRPTSLTDRPIVAWNPVARCPNRCRGSILTTIQAKRVLDDLAAFAVGTVFFCGDDIWAREDLIELVRHGSDRGLRIHLANDGTRISPSRAVGLAGAGLRRMGIAIDGTPETHDRLHATPSAFHDATSALNRIRRSGIPCAVNFTLQRSNAQELSAALGVVLRHETPAFRLHHSVPFADPTHHSTVAYETRVEVLRQLFAFAMAFPEVEVTTTNNCFDGVELAIWIAHSNPRRAHRIREILRTQSAQTRPKSGHITLLHGCGCVHPDHYSADIVLGNIHEESFSAIRQERYSEWLSARRLRDGALDTRCARCPELGVFGTMRPEGMPQRIMRGNPDWALPTFV